MDSNANPTPPPLGLESDERLRDPVIEAYKKDVDRTLIDETLRMTVEQRFENLMALQKFALELRRAMKAAATSATE